MSNNQMVNRLVSMDFIKASFKDEKGPIRLLMETIVRHFESYSKDLTAGMFVYQMENILETIKKFNQKGFFGWPHQGSLQREVGIPDCLFHFKLDFLRDGVFKLIEKACEESCDEWFIEALRIASEDYFYRRGIFEDDGDEPMSDEEHRKMLMEQERQRQIKEFGAVVIVKVVYANGKVEWY